MTSTLLDTLSRECELLALTGERGILTDLVDGEAALYDVGTNLKTPFSFSVNTLL